MGLFEGLLSLLFPLRDTERVVRKADKDALTSRLSPAPFPLSGVQASGLLPYLDPVVRAFVIEAKYHGSRQAQDALGAALAAHLRKEATSIGMRVALVPVPLGDERLAERGYNQVERICSAATLRLGESAAMRPDVLVRIRETAPQTTLSGEERAQNLADAFSAAQELDPSYAYVVVDDVVTTGATLRAAVIALQDAGATEVSAISLAR